MNPYRQKNRLKNLFINVSVFGFCEEGKLVPIISVPEGSEGDRLILNMCLYCVFAVDKLMLE
jgi:hypothetical protein